MEFDLIISFISNIILLMSLAVIYSIFPYDSKLSLLSKKIIMGFVVSFIGVSVMSNSYYLLPGVVFDSRAILISLSGMFLGVVPTIIGAIAMSAYRMYIGGVGTFVGVLWILSAATIGLLWRHLRLKNKKFEKYKITWIEFYLIGLFVQIAMVLLLLILPSDIKYDVISSVFFSLIVVYPLGALVISYFMYIQRSRFFQHIKTAESEKQYRTLFTKSKSMQFLIDPDNAAIIDCNDSALEKYQYSYDELLSLKITDLNISDEKSVLSVISKTLKNKKEHFFHQHKLKNGEIIDVEVYAGTVILNDKEYLLSSIFDITEKLEREKLFLDVDEKLKATLLSVGEGIVVTDDLSKIVLINEKAKTMLNLKGDPINQSIFDFVKITSNTSPKTFKDIYYDSLQNHSTYRNETPFMLNSNIITPVFVDFTLSPITFDENTNHGAILVFRDVTIEIERQDKIQFISEHDYLTTLYNRFHFDDQLNRLDTSRQLPISVIIGDVNGLKLLNDAFGHEEGDKLLIEIAQILKKATRSEDITSRWGGDEFAILLPQTTTENCEKVYKRIKDLCSKSMFKTISPSIALGYATKNNEEEDIRDILKFAEEKMYAEKLYEGAYMRRDLLKNIENLLSVNCEYKLSHIFRVTKLAEEFSDHLHLSKNEIKDLILLSQYHDIGLVNVDKSILNNPDKLDEMEFEKVKTHPEVGSRIANSIDEIKHITSSVLHHHEFYNGSGYPSRLSGSKIPLIARIFSILDAYEAMTSGRPYREKMSHKQAIKELKQNSGIQFDPVFVEQFIQMKKDD